MGTYSGRYNTSRTSLVTLNATKAEGSRNHVPPGKTFKDMTLRLEGRL
jgi:hypothetical protein